jgi:ATP-dependent Clp protease adapter protein ClpS
MHRIMMHVHQHGIGECGVFTYEVAETRCVRIVDFSPKHQLKDFARPSAIKKNCATTGKWRRSYL